VISREDGVSSIVRAELVKEIDTLRSHVATLERQLADRGQDGKGPLSAGAVPGPSPDEIALPYQSLDPFGYILTVNSAWLALLGYAKSDVLGKWFGDLLTPSSSKTFSMRFSRTASEADEGTDEFEVLRKDGTAIWVAVASRMVRDAAGAVRQIHCQLHDLTQRKRTEAALASRNLQLEAVRAVAAEMTRELNSNRLLDLISRRAAEMTGAENCGIYLWDEKEQALIPHAYHGPMSSRARFPRRLGEGLMGRVAQDRRGMLVNNYRESPLAHPRTLETTRITSVLAEPLVYRDRLLGVISVDHQHGEGLFTAQDQDLLTLLADQAAIAIENARLFRAEHERREQLEAIRAVSTEIAQELDLAKVLHIVAQRACELTSASAADIDLWDPERQLLVSETSYGHSIPRPAIVRRLGEGVMGTVAKSRRGLILNDYRSSPLAHPDTLAHTTITASLVEPLLCRDTLLGVIGVDHETPGRTFTAQDQALLQLFAAQAAIAIENARLYGETQRRQREAEVLTSLAQSITASLDLDTVLQRVAEGAKRLCGGDVAAIALLEVDTLAFRTWAGSVTPDYAALRIRAGQGLGGKVLVEGRTIRTANYREDPNIPPDFHELARTESVLAEIAVPIFIDGKVIGVLFVMHRTTRVFSQADEAVLARLADQAAIAIENARLFQEQQRAYKDLQRAQDEIVRTEKLRALGQMSAGIAHDLNNKLAVILGQAELLRRCSLSLEILEGVTTLEMAATDGAEVVRRLQDFARQRVDAALAPLDLRAVVSEVLELTRPRWEDEPLRRGKRIRVEKALDELPPIIGHVSEIRSALTNLIFNAVDAMANGGILSLEGKTDGAEVVLSVADTGAGMSEEIRQRIFEPFFTTKGVKGTGLGLSVVYGIMVRHGGHIDVASAPGRGSTFTLRFKAAPDASPSAQAPWSVSVSPRHLLVIDDEPLVRQTLGSLLRSAGHTVAEADCGASGLELLNQTPVDCVLTDLGMPGMTGWEVARAIKSRSRGIPVLLLTGWAEQADGDVSTEGVDRILTKPIQRGDLLQAIAEVTRDAASE
jgi:PAS domain S-box-containing protein